MTTTDNSHPTITDRQSWLSARRQLLAEEKDLTRRQDELEAKRRALPWVAVEKDYTFETGDGPASLAQLFGERSQLFVYHFMMGPEWEEGCSSCSFWADNLDGISSHLAARDVSLIAIARAPYPALSSYVDRMGWHDLRFASSHGSDFNMDFGVSFPPGHHDSPTYNYESLPTPAPMEELQGASSFARVGDEVFHTYSTFGRGVEYFNGAYKVLDLVPRGRDEADLDFGMSWLRRRDEY